MSHFQFKRKPYALTLALLASAASAMAAEPAPAAAPAPSSALSWNGVTLYGTVDLGFSTQSNGSAMSKNATNGVNYLIGKNSNGTQQGITPNGLSQSSIGVKGDFVMNPNVSLLFKLESGFDPVTMTLANGPASLRDNNGFSSSTAPNTNSSSARAGQVFNGAAFVGIKHNNVGTFTFGRQSSVLKDNVGKYDPAPSNAFSLIGNSGTTAGGGNTENGTMNDSFKYEGKVGPVRMAAIFQPGGAKDALIASDGYTGTAYQLSLGSDIGNFSFDVTGSQINSTLALAAESTNVGTLKGTESDNTAWALMGKYTMGNAQVLGGFETIQYKNPNNPLSAGVTSVGNYTIGTLTQNAYNNTKTLNVTWIGLKYAVTPKLTVSGAYYNYNQSYANTSCSDASASTCSGTEDVYSLLAIYKVMNPLELYAGVTSTTVNNGIANGYVGVSSAAGNNSAYNLTTMVGARYKF